MSLIEQDSYAIENNTKQEEGILPVVLTHPVADVDAHESRTNEKNGSKVQQQQQVVKLQDEDGAGIEEHIFFDTKTTNVTTLQEPTVDAVTFVHNFMVGAQEEAVYDNGADTAAVVTTTVTGVTDLEHIDEVMIVTADLDGMVDTAATVTNTAAVATADMEGIIANQYIFTNEQQNDSGIGNTDNDIEGIVPIFQQEQHQPLLKTSPQDESNTHKKQRRKRLRPAESAATIAKKFQPGTKIPSNVKPPPSNARYSRQSGVTQQLPPIPCSAGASVSQLDPDNPKHFDHFLFQLLMYKTENNTYNVQKDEYPELHTWMGNIKKMYKQFSAFADGPQAGSLKRGMTCTVAQIKVLEHLHVPLTSRGNDHWNRFYDLLWQYKDRHGHVLVPRVCEIPGLGDWVTDQRRHYKLFKEGKATQMTKERRDKLACLGFNFSVRHRPEWDQRYDELVAYNARYGHTKVPQNYKDSKALGKWVAKQREQYKNHLRGKHSFLTPYRLEKLNAINFSWRIRGNDDTGGIDSDNDVDDVIINNSIIPDTRVRAVKKMRTDTDTTIMDNYFMHDCSIGELAIDSATIEAAAAVAATTTDVALGHDIVNLPVAMNTDPLVDDVVTAATLDNDIANLHNVFVADEATTAIDDSTSPSIENFATNAVQI